jgi:glycine oxidase
VIRTPRCYIVTRCAVDEQVRVVIGATVEEQGFDTAVTADGVFRLLEAAWEVLPEVGELELLSARAGLRPGTPDNAPLIGRGDTDGLLWATGHYRNGVLLAPLTASAVACLLAGEDTPEELLPFLPGRFASAEVA